MQSYLKYLEIHSGYFFNTYQIIQSVAFPHILSLHLLKFLDKIMVKELH